MRRQNLYEEEKSFQDTVKLKHRFLSDRNLPCIHGMFLGEKSTLQRKVYSMILFFPNQMLLSLCL